MSFSCCCSSDKNNTCDLFCISVPWHAGHPHGMCFVGVVFVWERGFSGLIRQHRLYSESSGDLSASSILPVSAARSLFRAVTERAASSDSFLCSVDPCLVFPLLKHGLHLLVHCTSWGCHVSYRLLQGNFDLTGWRWTWRWCGPGKIVDQL